MSTPYEERAARLHEVEQVIAGTRAEIRRLEAERGRLDEQLTSATSRTKDFAALAAARVKRDVVEVEIAEAHERLPYLQEELRELRHAVAQRDVTLAEDRRVLDELQNLFANEVVFRWDWAPTNEYQRLHRRAAVARMRLREHGVDVPDAIVIRVALRDIEPRPASPAPVVAEEDEAIGAEEEDEEPIAVE
jgi:hypothetical protein